MVQTAILIKAEDDYKLPPNMGWKAWSADKNGKLSSPQQGTLWNSSALHGQCTHHGADFNKCFNDPRHMCGIHSAKDPGLAADYRWSRAKGTPVMGSLMHHGTVLEGDKGHRSSKATIHSIYAGPDEELAGKIEQNYPGVRVLREHHPWITETGNYSEDDKWQGRKAAWLAKVQATRAAKEKLQGSLSGSDHSANAKQLGESKKWHELVPPSGKPVLASRKYHPGDVVYPAGSGLDDKKYHTPHHWVGSYTQPGGGGHVVIDPAGNIRKLPNVQLAHEHRGGDPARRGASEADMRGDLLATQQKNLKRQEKLRDYYLTHGDAYRQESAAHANKEIDRLLRQYPDLKATPPPSQERLERRRKLNEEKHKKYMDLIRGTNHG